MLCEELSLRVSTLLKGLIRRHAQKKEQKRNLAVYSKNYPCLPIEHELQDFTAKYCENSRCSI